MHEDILLMAEAFRPAANLINEIGELERERRAALEEVLRLLEDAIRTLRD